MKKIIGVCACPAGIAHTYMAAESLERYGRKLGYEVKIETNGAGGVENRLDEDDIKNADFVIIAADTSVETERFIGKPLIETSVSEAVRNAANIFEKIANKDVEIYKGGR
ncbi:PTS fructose transporter subunit IIB [Tissierellaceae bacterium BX21]|uniref:PTS fructose transporter subunit IIB n=2 Tax=Paratissierella segnis TaxID=2763679 RepID=A0A926EPG3_9FIRM|nr:PTS fructose transporter subunit IIB [Paratissierella segnis]